MSKHPTEYYCQATWRRFAGRDAFGKLKPQEELKLHGIIHWNPRAVLNQAGDNVRSRGRLVVWGMAKPERTPWTILATEWPRPQDTFKIRNSCYRVQAVQRLESNTPLQVAYEVFLR